MLLIPLISSIIISIIIIINNNNNGNCFHDSSINNKWFY